LAKVRTLTQLQTALDSEMGWRIFEISAFRLASKGAGTQQRALVRGGVAMVYAHWEGFIKTSSELYLNYVNNQGLRYCDLKNCFIVFGLKSRLSLIVDSRRSKLNIEALDFILSEINKPAKMSLGSAIDTESNLTSIVFSNIAQSIDIPLDKYETKFNLIDESLVKRRNSIAHGEYLDINQAQFIDLVDEILTLMRLYKKDLENAASLSSYKRPLAPLVVS
jgi:hypothetical protein